MNYKNPATSPPTRTAYDLQPASGPHTTVERLQCTARSKSTGVQCKAYPMHGGKVCRVHGGAARQVRAAASRRLKAEAVEAEVRNALAFESLVGVDDPLAAQSLLAAEALAMKEALAARVNSLEQLRYSASGSGTEQLRAEVALYERAMDRAGKFLDLLAKSGFEEKRIVLAQAQGAMMKEALDRIFDRLELSQAQRLLIPVVVPQELRAIMAERDRG